MLDREIKDHPRRCGENLSWVAIQIFSVGITPAGAGKTDNQNPITPEQKDHPRRCGENMNEMKVFNNAEGSPPQVRGKHPPPWGLLSVIRITPAGAGKTFIDTFSGKGLEDHPRRCGENVACIGWCFVVSGSPPQVRGKPTTRTP